MIGLGLPAGRLRVMCLGAHPDDIEIGCGGTLLRLARRGAEVGGLIMTGTSERRAEAEYALPSFVPGATVSVIGLPDGRLPAHWERVKDELEAAAAARGPVDLVLAPRVDDAHQDHRLIGGLAATVWRDALILHYEIPKWDGDLATTSHYVPLDAIDARHKVDLLDRAYPSQLHRDWWDHEMFLGLMRLRGIECHQPYAEGFHLRKAVIDPGVGEP